jgi:hypothetical protein
MWRRRQQHVEKAAVAAAALTEQATAVYYRGLAARNKNG